MGPRPAGLLHTFLSGAGKQAHVWSGEELGVACTLHIHPHTHPPPYTHTHPAPPPPVTLACEELICLHGWSQPFSRPWEGREGPRLRSRGVRPPAPSCVLCLWFCGPSFICCYFCDVSPPLPFLRHLCLL